MGGFCVGATKVKKSSSSQQLGVHDPAPPALLKELLLLVSSYSLYQITGNIILKSVWN